MNGSDSFELLLNELAKELRDLIEKLALVGLLYTSKLVVKSLRQIYIGTRTYLIPKLIPDEKWVKSLGDWAVVSGCSNKIGVGFCIELAKKKINLILIDEESSQIDTIADNLIRVYGIEVIKIVKDLSNLDSYAEIEKLLQNKDVGVFVNSSIIASDLCHFHTENTQSVAKLINTNCMSSVQLTRMVLPSMVIRNKGAVIFTSAINGFLPSPYNSIYSSSDSFMENFMNSLRYEYNLTDLKFEYLNLYFLKSRLGRKNITINDGLKYAKNSLRSLGYAKSTCGYWLSGFLLLLIKMIPSQLLNTLYAREQRRNMINGTGKSPNSLISLNSSSDLQEFFRKS